MLSQTRSTLRTLAAPPALEAVGHSKMLSQQQSGCFHQPTRHKQENFMTYANPELVLVGSAQNLVLGDSHTVECNGLDEPDQGELFDTIEDW